MALRSALLDHVRAFDIPELFDTSTSNTSIIWDSMAREAQKIFSPYRHLLDSEPDWVNWCWEQAKHYHFTLSLPSGPILDALDADHVLAGADQRFPPSTSDPFLYFSSGKDLRKRSGGLHWNIGMGGGGIRSVVGAMVSFGGGSPTPANLSLYWTRLNDAIQDIQSFIASAASTCATNANAFYTSRTKAGGGQWEGGNKDLTVLFHLVLPQFFPAHYLETREGYSQKEGILQLLDSFAALSGVPRKSVNLWDYAQYSSAYRFLLAVYDKWLSTDKTILATPHFDYFTQFLADLQSRSNMQHLLLHKKALVLYGPPGTGKTHAAEVLAERLTGSKSGERIHFIQFHPSYSYQDFIIGIRPTVNSGQVTYTVEPGVFYRVAAEAAQASLIARSVGKTSSTHSETEETHESNEAGDSESDPSSLDFFILIIDEINRPDLAKVLGEIMYCIEYRQGHEKWRPLSLPHLLTNPNLESVFQPGKSITDPFKGGAEFYVPDNLLIIGTMNDADRSISGFDKALRRRFAWARLDFSTVELRSILEEKFKEPPGGTPGNLPRFILRAQRLNDLLKKGMATEKENDYEYRLPCKGMEIGHTHFVELADVMKMFPTRSQDILPLHLDNLWLYFLEPVLEEMFGGGIDEYRQQLDSLKKIFTQKL